MLGSRPIQEWVIVHITAGRRACWPMQRLWLDQFSSPLILFAQMNRWTIWNKRSLKDNRRNRRRAFSAEKVASWLTGSGSGGEISLCSVPGMASYRMGRRQRAACQSERGVGCGEKKQVSDCDKVRNGERNWAWVWLERDEAGMWRESWEQIALSLITNYISQRIYFHTSPCTRTDM